jgi:probable rRNA maturation factor
MKINNVRKGGVKIIIRNLQKKIPISPRTSARIKKALLKACASEGIKKSGEITVCFVNNQEIKELNLNYLGRNNPTDVMVFDTSASLSINADIVISTDTAVSHAKIFKTTPLYELYLYVIHGLLHILGYDDETKKDRLIMRKKEASLLNLLHLTPNT